MRDMLDGKWGSPLRAQRGSRYSLTIDRDWPWRPSMTWLDCALASPTIGLLFEPWFESQHDYLKQLRPMLEAWDKAGHTVVIADLAGITDVKVDVSTGFSYSITINNVVGQFAYKQKVTDVPGRVPELRTTPDPQKYSALISQMTDELNTLLGHLLGGRRRVVKRIGVVADSRIDRAAPLPGVEALLRHLAKPWGAELDSCNAKLTARLRKSEESVDKCHHTIKIDNGEQPNDIRLMLDWQRYFEGSGQTALAASELSTKLTTWVDAALDYYERFGRGELNYESSNSDG